MHKWIESTNIARNIRAFTPSWVVNIYNKTTSKSKIERPRLEGKLRQQVVEELRDDVEKLELFTGRDL
jgi:hypothetical protein